ncbi:MAG: hypothetical protein RL095_1234 [Verrucomicrobiota bacterium]|jgi:phosphate acetyltransferase
MKTSILLVPTGPGVGLTSAGLGLIRAFDRLGVRVSFCKPMGQTRLVCGEPERSTALVRLGSTLHPPEPICRERVESLLAEGDMDRLMEEACSRCEEAGDAADVLVVEGLAPQSDMTYSNRLNTALARTLDAEVVLVSRLDKSGTAALADQLSIYAKTYDSSEKKRVVGVVVNRVPETQAWPVREVLAKLDLPLLAHFPEIPNLSWPRCKDLVRQLGPQVLHEGDLERRIERVSVLAQAVPGALAGLRPGSLLITPGDRSDIIMAASLAALSGTQFAGLLLTAVPPEPRVMELTRAVRATGLPILAIEESTYEVSRRVHEMDVEVPADDRVRGEKVMAMLADRIDPSFIQRLAASTRRRQLSPAAFRHRLLSQARSVRRRIVLPEGEEPRTLRAAVRCQEHGIAQCVLLGQPDAVRRAAAAQGLVLPPEIEIVDPAALVGELAPALYELRKSKGLSEAGAAEAVLDPIVCGTLLLKLGRVDGLVSGAIHTTAHTIRPALQFIKTAPGCALVSSCFFMCLPEQVVLFADCAVNPDPSAEQLADIALQTADSALAFGLEPRVAMISYATRDSGEGADVDKVRQATEIVRRRRPELPVDGPLQYDAAAIASVAKSKAPGSAVAGQATVFVFPDLNTGNTVYKAVQRSAQVLAMGPMLQGLAKPVNDLSRGALVEDIIYTIALTAIQAQ